MNRREFLQCAALITAGASQAPVLWALSREQNDFIASQPPYINRVSTDFFNTAQRQTVTAIAEHIIPKTDTPGATDAGVPKFIEGMVANWFDDKERSFFVSELASLDQGKDTFLSLNEADQLDVLNNLEEQAADTAWFTSGNAFRIWDSTAPFVCQFKELTVLGFMLSKTAEEEFLRPNAMGSFNGSIPLSEGDAAYSLERPMRSFSAPIPGVMEDE